MPIYEYVCQACGAHTEIMQKVSDPPAKKCPSCGRSKLAKQVSAAGFRLGGGGWYETDFKSDKKRNLAGDTEAPKAAPDAPAAPAAPAAAKETKAAKPAKEAPAKSPDKPRAAAVAKPAAPKPAK